MSTKFGLGRGLAELQQGMGNIPDISTLTGAGRVVVKQIPLIQIGANPDQPRKTFSDEELFEDGKRNWAKTNGKEFSVCRLIHLNTIANFKNFRGKIRKWKKNIK